MALGTRKAKMVAPSNIVIHLDGQGIESYQEAPLRFFRHDAGTGTSLIGEVSLPAGISAIRSALPIQLPGSDDVLVLIYGYGIDGVSCSVMISADDTVSLITDPLIATEPGADGAFEFEWFVGHDGMYVVRAWHHTGRGEHYKVIYRIGASGPVVFAAVGASFSVPYITVADTYVHVPVVGVTDGGKLYLRSQTTWGATGDYEYYSIDLVSGAIGADAPAANFPTPYSSVDNTWVYYFKWSYYDNGPTVTEYRSTYAQYEMDIVGDISFSGPPDWGPGGSVFEAYPTNSAWATALDGSVSPAITYLDIDPGTNGQFVPFVMSVFGKSASEPPASWWKNKTGAIEVAT